MKIRQARIDEAPLLTQIAVEAKSYWGYPPDWITHWESDLTVSPEFIASNEVYLADDDGTIHGFYALCVNGDTAELEHMWVRPDMIGKGVGKELFLDAMDRAGSLSVKRVELSADPNAAGFYEKLGAEKFGETDSEVLGVYRKLPRMKIEPL